MSSSNYYDLEKRTFKFALNVREYVKELNKSITNIDDIKQLIRSSGSVAANYIEANESLSKKDFIFRIKICRKEAKESRLFLRLLDISRDPDMEKGRALLSNESLELTKIFGSIITKSE